MRDDIRKYFEALLIPSVALSAVGVAIFLGLLTIALLWISRPAPQTFAPPTAVLTVIPWATSTPQPLATSTLVEEPTAAGPPTPRPGEIGVGSIVQIVGTQGDGLNIRAEPGLSSTVFFLAYDAEVFEVRDGPVEVDGITWWFLVTPVDVARSGWAAAEYLALITNP